MTATATTVTTISGKRHMRGKNDIKAKTHRTKKKKKKSKKEKKKKKKTRIIVGVGNRDAFVATGKAIADAYNNRIYIPLDFELLGIYMPFYQSALGDGLEYELTFNDYSCVIQIIDTDAFYDIENISLGYDMVTQPDLARMTLEQYKGLLAIEKSAKTTATRSEISTLTCPPLA